MGSVKDDEEDEIFDFSDIQNSIYEDMSFNPVLIIKGGDRRGRFKTPTALLLVSSIKVVSNTWILPCHIMHT